MKRFRIGLIGDRDDSVVAHRAIPRALEMACTAAGVAGDIEWVGTETITGAEAVAGYDGLWCVPASPYRSMDGALTAIRYARERKVPFLGTCGGFQHAMVEYARNVLGWHDAEHAETAPDSARPVIVPLLCSLVEVSDAVHLVAGSRLARAYGKLDLVEGYHCSYGLGAAFREALEGRALRISAVDDQGDVRGVELDDHPFFVATLFQPERAALQGRLPPPVAAFVQAMVDLH